MRRLLDAGLDIDAVRLLPYLMPIRQAIWWGCMCSWHSVGGSPNEREDEALRAAVTWVRLPAEAEWQVARQAANADGCDSAGGCCAEAISWTGFWTPTEKWKHRDVNVAARLIAGAALTAVGRLKHANAPRRLLQLSVEIARGIHPWDGMPSR